MNEETKEIERKLFDMYWHPIINPTEEQLFKEKVAWRSWLARAELYERQTTLTSKNSTSN